MDVTIRAEVLARVGALDLQVVMGALWVGDDGESTCLSLSSLEIPPLLR